ncbi:hypothetical protein A1Q2_02600 [Trichosporon asahii var. asahii CBS 8904]|uniref:Uncharacterized protein n=1 Tax=Trichosporon asahii var. asahii (strain CBS 8904) TaxID=1220162 RepID=K1VRG8_TRIAC|nr:hypothetical protein A1Q2_02600 [Trichosporon asahii var. asahii CBS 8904]
MFASAVRARNPLIKFLGKRSWPTSAAKPAVHPLAPKEIQASFDDFLKKFSSAAGASVSSGPVAGAIPLYKESSKPADFEDWEAPSYLWQQREFSDAEIDAVMSGGATYITDGP